MDFTAGLDFALAGMVWRRFLGCGAVLSLDDPERLVDTDMVCRRPRVPAVRLRRGFACFLATDFRPFEDTDTELAQDKR
jgi:hypothetical protein